MSKIEVDTIDTVTGTSTLQIGSTNVSTINLGASGDSVVIPSGVTITNNGTQTGFSKLIQVVNFQTGAVATGTTLIPRDDTIPQNTEGNEFMTLAITPQDASNILIVNVSAMVAPSTSAYMIGALFVGATSDAISAQLFEVPDSANQGTNLNLTHYLVAGVTTELTFKIRIGLDRAGTATFNGSAGARKFGTIPKSSMTIMEIQA
jgi:hypothetical protein